MIWNYEVVQMLNDKSLTSEALGVSWLVDSDDFSTLEQSSKSVTAVKFYNYKTWISSFYKHTSPICPSCF